MPWSPGDVKRHNKSADPNKWTAIANAILAKSGDDGKAIRIANAKAPKKSSRKVSK